MSLFSRKAVSLGGLVDQAAGELGLKDKLLFGRLLDNWQTLAGEAVANHVKIKKLEGGILYLEADGPVWKSEIIIRRETLAEAINDRLGDKIVRSVKVV